MAMDEEYEEEDYDGAAGMTVCGIPEVLEIIILHLPLPAILLDQRVNKTWRDTITGSPKLQQALFFRPATAQALTSVDCANLTLDCPNATQCDTVTEGPMDQRPETSIRRWVYDTNDLSATRHPIMNPLLSTACPDLFGWVLPEREDPVERSRPVAGCLARPDASWRKILLTQPPVRNISVDHGNASHWHHMVRMSAGAAVRLQDLETSAQEFHGHLSEVAGLGELTELGRQMSRGRVVIRAEQVLQAIAQVPGP